MSRPSFKDFKEKSLNNPAVREKYEAPTPEFVVQRQLIAQRHQAGLTQKQMTDLKSEAVQERRGNFEAFLGAVPNVEVEVETDRVAGNRSSNGVSQIWRNVF